MEDRKGGALLSGVADDAKEEADAGGREMPRDGFIAPVDQEEGQGEEEEAEEGLGLSGVDGSSGGRR